MTSKEAVCVIIDGNISMTKLAATPSSLKSSDGDDNDNDQGHGQSNGAQPDNGNGSDSDTATARVPSRFDVAKGVAIDFISSLMIRSKTHEYVQFWTLTRTLREHACQPQFDNLYG